MAACKQSGTFNIYILSVQKKEYTEVRKRIYTG